MDQRWTGRVEKTVLANGLTLLLVVNRSAPVVASVAHVRAGYFDEPDHLVGVSHVLEHMFFKGTPTRRDGAMAEETQLLGGYLNAGTIYDKTMYYTVVPAGPGVLDRVVDIQADGLRNALIEEDSLARELEVIIQEVNRKRDSPSAVTTETMYSQLFAQHRMRRWRIGTEEGLRALTARDVKDYYCSRYRPDRTILGVVGDVDAERVRQAVESAYGDWTGPDEPVEGSPAETDPPAPTMKNLSGDVRRPQVAIGWRTVGATDEDAVALDLAAGVLSNGRNGWLPRGVRKPGLASSASASHYCPTDVGVFDLQLAGDPDRLETGVNTALGLLQTLRDEGPSPEDLERVRSLIQVGLARRMEGMDTQALTLCQYEAFGDYALLDRAFDQLLETGTEQVRDVARRYLDPSGASATVFSPEGEEPPLKTDWPPTVTATRVNPVSSAGFVSSGGSQPEKNERVGTVLCAETPTTTFLARERRGTGLAHVSLLFPRLREMEKPETAGLSAMVVRSALRGTRAMDAETLAHAAESLGGSIATVMLSGSIGYSMTVPVDRVGAAAGLLGHLGEDARLADDDIIIERGLVATDARRAEDDMYSYPVLQTLARALPGASYGLPTLGRPGQVELLTPDSVRDWYARLLRRRAVITVAGDDDAERLLDTVAAGTSWSGTEVPSVPDVPAWQAGEFSEARHKAQTAVAMAFQAAGHGKDRHALLVLSSLLSGLSGRLFDVLREQRSLAYTVNATAWQRHGTGAVLAYIGTDPNREHEARDGLLEVLSGVAETPPDADELRRATHYVSGGQKLRTQHASSLASEMFEAWNRDELASIPEEVERLEAVSAESVSQLAAEVFVPGTRSEFVLRGS